MSKSNMTLRIEPELKEEAAALFASMGLDLSTATGIFFRQALRVNGLPFKVKGPKLNKVTRETIAKADKGEEMTGPFDSVEDMMGSLNA